VVNAGGPVIGDVEVAKVDPGRFQAVLDPPLSRSFAQRLERAADRVSGRRLWHLNPTDQGGGDADMLYSWSATSAAPGSTPLGNQLAIRRLLEAEEHLLQARAAGRPDVTAEGWQGFFLVHLPRGGANILGRPYFVLPAARNPNHHWRRMEILFA